MFALESLAALRGIGEVQIKGPPDWFKQCLETCVRGEGGDVQEVEWPLVEVKRRKDCVSKPKKSSVTTRKWYNPMLNWKEFAERNGIAAPENIDRFYIPDDAVNGASRPVGLGRGGQYR